MTARRCPHCNGERLYCFMKGRKEVSIELPPFRIVMVPVIMPVEGSE